MIKALIAVIMTLAPYLSESLAKVHVHSAFIAGEKYEIEPEILLAIAWAESRYQDMVVSRIHCENDICKRKRGKITSRQKPEGAKPTYYCGALQVGGHVSWEKCMGLDQNVPLNYLTGAENLRNWLNDPKCKRRKGEDRLVCALHGYGGGYAAVERYSSKYPMKVIGLRNKIKRLAATFYST